MRSSIRCLAIGPAPIRSVRTTQAEPEGLPPLVLASAAGAAGAALAARIAGTLPAIGGDWERRLPAAVLAGAVAASAAAAASVLGLLLLGLVTGALYLIFLTGAARRLGAAAEIAGSCAVAGTCGTVATAILGPAGFLSVQLIGLAAVLGLAWSAGLLLAQLPRRWAALRPAADSQA